MFSDRRAMPNLPAGNSGVASGDAREGRLAPNKGQRRGTTLVELLVVFALIALLIAILLPALRSVRAMSQNTVCAARLRDLALAGQMYRQDHGRYPEPSRFAPAGSGTNGAGQGKILPHQVQRRLLNDIRRYLKFPHIEAGTPASRLPPHVQSPAAEKVSNGRGPKKNHLTEPEHYYTGFIYTARLDEGSATGAGTASLPPDAAVLLRPDRPATMSHGGRAVIWADDLSFITAGEGNWRFVHTRGGGLGNGTDLFSYRDARLAQGQHRAYTDGSVEWIDAADLSLTAPESDANGASYRVDLAYWWF